MWYGSVTRHFYKAECHTHMIRIIEKPNVLSVNRFRSSCIALQMTEVVLLQSSRMSMHLQFQTSFKIRLYNLMVKWKGIYCLMWRTWGSAVYILIPYFVAPTQPSNASFVHDIFCHFSSLLTWEITLQFANETQSNSFDLLVSKTSYFAASLVQKFVINNNWSIKMSKSFPLKRCF